MATRAGMSASRTIGRLCLDTTAIPWRIMNVPHSSTFAAAAVVARLAFVWLVQVNAYRGSLRYPRWCVTTTSGILRQRAVRFICFLSHLKLNPICAFRILTIAEM
jgi:hypothetical protein